MRTFSGVGSRLVGLDRPVGEHPDVGRFDAFAHRDGARVGLVGNAAEAARHHPPAVGRRGGVDAQHEGPRHQPAVLPARRRRQAHDVLADIIDAAQPIAATKLGALVRGRVRRRRRSAGSSRPGRASRKAPATETLIERGQHALALVGLAAPPGRDVGHDEVFADQPAREARQEAEQGARFDEAGARHVLDRDAAGADRLEQARHADARGGD